MFKKILYPIDNYEASIKRIPLIADLAAKFNAEVLLLHCQEIPFDNRSVSDIKDADYEEGIFIKAKKLMDENKELLEKSGIFPACILKKGNPRQLIIETAKEERCDLIVIGSRSSGTIGGLLLGSTSNYVIHHTRTPVLLIS